MSSGFDSEFSYNAAAKTIFNNLNNSLIYRLSKLELDFDCHFNWTLQVRHR